ncbi:MAG: hypothetical protein KIT72_16405 [Polyangiaceae bacterium]|nr:hypothetical protein [Polyangiaceae bacterium]MCW5791999.1 hypothetical protein [Polyangiaceae bacterium]
MLALSSCGVSTLEDGDHAPSKNSCESTDECGANATCWSNTCRASRGVHDSLLLVVTPGSTTMGVGGVRFLVPQEHLAEPRPSLDLELAPPSVVRGTVTVDDRALACDVHVTFTPVDRVRGLPPDEHTVRTASGKLEASIPAGSYEVYVQPTKEPTFACDLAPRLHREVSVGAGAFELPLSFGSSQRLHLEFKVGGMDLAGWRAVVLDSVTGRRLSGERSLSAELWKDQSYVAEIEFNPVAGDALTGQELIQLAPPEGVLAPTLVWKREGLEVFQPGQLAMDLRGVDLEMGSYAGFIEGPDRRQQAGRLRFTSLSLTGLGGGLFGVFNATAEADESGAFSISALPLGTYRVHVTPAEGSGLGAKEVEIEVTGKGQGGATIVLEALAPISGSVVFDQPGRPGVAGATVHAVAMPRQVEFQAFRAALGERPFVPRASSGITTSEGTFKLDADPGTYDLSVRPPAGSNLPWLVRTRVAVPLTQSTLGELSIHAPVLQPGTVSIGGQPVAGASVKAYAYLGEDGFVAERARAVGVVAVGEAYTDARGGFVLALPSR